MKQVIFAAVLQALVLFILIGVLCWIIRGDFFYVYLAPLLGLVAGLVRFVGGYMLELLRPEEDKKE
ncbi:hypothetical protein [Streptococcus himalayensis]|uniref:Excreted peptide n=1 Tax=Streptococcus himalayensis TaxID=1888195 RepID=A0A917A2J5_9STRE|nr:hypothetical protein [Streptococcus himalayensis]GGE23507.1 hypothetical protein GCM10011510_00690 [Streptococcus himalayensis]